MYRLGIRPWERYGAAAAGSIAALLDREESERPRPLGRALDLGCGRGQFTPSWLGGAGRRSGSISCRQRSNQRGAVAPTVQLTSSVTLPSWRQPTWAPSTCSWTSAASRVLMPTSDGPSAEASAPWPTPAPRCVDPRLRTEPVGGLPSGPRLARTSRWPSGTGKLLVAEPADTAGLGWPMNRTAPHWFRLRRR
jgi:hypothetical protein